MKVPKGDLSDWDGLLGWYVDYTEVHPETLVDRAMRQWRKAAVAVLTSKRIERMR